MVVASLTLQMYICWRVPTSQCIFPSHCCSKMEFAHNLPHQSSFKFASPYLHEDACLPIFLPEIKDMRVNMIMYAETYDFAIANDWWGINVLPLCLGIDKTLMVYS